MHIIEKGQISYIQMVPIRYASLGQKKKKNKEIGKQCRID